MITKPTQIVAALTVFLAAGCSDKNDDAAASIDEAPASAVLFKSGANISGVNGIHFGPNGMLYATSVIGSTISVVDTQTKKIVSEYINKAKKRLAYLVTADCHSETSAEEAENKAVSIFEKNISDNIDEIDFNIDLEIKIVEAITSKNLVSSKSEAKRLIEGGGIKLGDDQIKDINQLITKKDNDKILKIGKKKLFKLKFN